MTADYDKTLEEPSDMTHCDRHDLDYDRYCCECRDEAADRRIYEQKERDP